MTKKKLYELPNGHHLARGIRDDEVRIIIIGPIGKTSITKLIAKFLYEELRQISPKGSISVDDPDGDVHLTGWITRIATVLRKVKVKIIPMQVRQSLNQVVSNDEAEGSFDDQTLEAPLVFFDGKTGDLI